MNVPVMLMLPCRMQKLTHTTTAASVLVSHDTSLVPLKAKTSITHDSRALLQAVVVVT